MPSSVPTVESFRLGPFVSSRIWIGLWQLSSPEWGTAKVSKVLEAMNRHVEMGYTGFGTHDASYSLNAILIFMTDMVRFAFNMDLDLSAIDLFYRVSLSARPTYPEPHTSDSRPLWQCRTSFCKCLLFEGTLQNEIENHRENSTNLQNMPTKSLPEQNGAFLKVSNPPRNISFQLCVSECSGCKHGKSICFRYLQYISKSRINTYNKTMAVSLARLLR